MGDIIKEMLDQVPDRFLWLQVLLSAVVAIMTDHFRLAIEAIFFFSFL